MARKRDGQFRITTKATPEQIKKTRRKAAIPKTIVRPVKTTPLVEFMMQNKDSGKTSRELILEFRETCGHSYREIAYLPGGNGARVTFQVCNICGQFVKGKKGGKLVKTDSSKEEEED